ncbi:MAG: 2-hydroxyglutaryl-CoA dehydratase, partial [Firmicutes bacterium]|nr:2-hydroxyglutaryl-CoA dehydratase [Bacillota bacterium]
FYLPDDFNEVFENGKEFINPGVKMGEGWLLTSEVVTLVRSGVNNVVMAQPFGCLPNHIVAKGMIRKIKDRYPMSNIVAIDFDPSASKVNQENRIRLMMANAKLNEGMFD